MNSLGHDLKLFANQIGFGSASGVFREYYFKHPPLEGNQLVASIGVLIVVRRTKNAAACLETCSC